MLTSGHLHSMARPRAILFDKDGTLFDFQATWGAWAVDFIYRLADGDDAQARRIANAVAIDLDRKRVRPESVAVAGTPWDLSLAIHAVLDDPPDVGVLAQRIVTESLSAEPREAVPLATYFAGLNARGWRIAVVTNDGEAAARRQLDTVGATPFVEFLSGYDSGHGAKPEPGQLLAACAHFGIAPSDAIMVGDSTHDLQAARAAGMVGVGVLTGLAVVDDLAPHAAVVLPDIGAVPDWIGTHLT